MGSVGGRLLALATTHLPPRLTATPSVPSFQPCPDRESGFYLQGAAGSRRDGQLCPTLPCPALNCCCLHRAAHPNGACLPTPACRPRDSQLDDPGGEGQHHGHGGQPQHRGERVPAGERRRAAAPEEAGRARGGRRCAVTCPSQPPPRCRQRCAGVAGSAASHAAAPLLRRPRSVRLPADLAARGARHAVLLQRVLLHLRPKVPAAARQPVGLG